MNKYHLTYFVENMLRRQWHLVEQPTEVDQVPKGSILLPKNYMRHGLNDHMSYDYHNHHRHSLVIIVIYLKWSL